MKEMESLIRALNESRYTVAFGSTGLMEESGQLGMRNQFRAYEVEKKYGYSPEEMFSAAFFSTRPEKFYEYYKNEVLHGNVTPGESYFYLKELVDKNIIQTIITNNICNFFGKAGCKNVLAIHGNVEENECMNCGKKFSEDYILRSKGIPCCDECGKIIRPQVRMFGEMVDNRIMTQAINEISEAEVLLIIGSDLSSSFAERYVKYFQGKKLILINPEEDFKDKIADLVIHRPIKEVLKKVLEGYPAR